MREKRPQWLLELTLALVFAIIVGYLQPSTRAQDINQVGLVVDFGDHHITRCVEFSESKFTGYDALLRAGLDPVVAGSGGMVAVCDIRDLNGNETSGCKPSNCFCQCQGSTCLYWAYHRLIGGSWQYSQIGASGREVQHGDVEGWAWGEGSLNAGGAEPPVRTFDEICAPPPDTPAPPTRTPAPTATPQLEQEATAVPELEVWFRLDENPITAGSCTMVRWDTANAREVYLDGERVSPISGREVCPTEAEEYNLRVVGPEGEETHTLILGVTEGPDAPSPTPQPETVAPTPTLTSQAATTTPSPSPTPALEATPTPSPSPTAQAAASVSLTPTQTTETPSPTADTEATEPDTSERSPEDTAEQASPFEAAGYAVFGVIATGLLGWLIFITKVRT